jgi:hypothetical protein
MLNISHLLSVVKDVELSRISSSELCSICFASGFETAFVCFDGNFQLITLETRLKKQQNISTQGLKDKRIFIEKESIVCIKSNKTDYSPMKDQKKQQKQ